MEVHFTKNGGTFSSKRRYVFTKTEVRFFRKQYTIFTKVRLLIENKDIKTIKK